MSSSLVKTDVSFIGSLVVITVVSSGIIVVGSISGLKHYSSK